MIAEITQAPHDLGAGMQGMGAGVMQFVDRITEASRQVTYVEIGVSDGITLSEIAARIATNTESWRAIGIDLPKCRHETTQRHMIDKGLRVQLVRQPIVPKWNRVTLILQDSHTLLEQNIIDSVHLALIDGCHGKPCVSLDFLLLEPLIVPGGFVMFHDFGEDQIGQEQSPPDHCPIVGVNDACSEFGLLNDAREGWRFVGTIIGDKHRGSADMGVFQKTEN